jgi:hypothetical protein
MEAIVRNRRNPDERSRFEGKLPRSRDPTAQYAAARRHADVLGVFNASFDSRDRKRLNRTGRHTPAAAVQDCSTLVRQRDGVAGPADRLRLTRSRGVGLARAQDSLCVIRQRLRSRVESR